MVDRSPLSSDTPSPVPGVDYRVLFLHSAVPMLTLDVNVRAILEVNDACVELLGLPREQILGRPGRDFLVEPSPDHVLRLRALRNERLRTIAGVRTASGERTVELNQVPAGPDGVIFVQAVDLTDLLGANIALEDRTIELQAKSSALESFAARIAHDLRSPLSSVAGFADLLRNDAHDFSDEQRHQMLERIAANARSLGTMISEVMDEAVGHWDEGVDVDSVQGLFASLRSILESELVASGAVLRTASEVDRLPVPAGMLRQPLLNLVSNSIKYRDPSRPLEIEVSVSQADEATVLRVRDNGKGVGDDVEAVFAKGERGRSSAGTVGSGLGLPFARQALRDIGGDLLVEPQDGPGVCFRIDLPVLTVHRDPAGLGGTLASGLRGAQLEAVFDAGAVPALLIDMEHRRVLRANRAAERLLGVPADAIVGRAGPTFLADPSAGDALRRQVLDAVPGQPVSIATELTTSTGRTAVMVLGVRVPESNLGLFQLLER